MRARTGSIDTTAQGRHRVRVTIPTGGRRTLGVYDSIDEAEAARLSAIAIIATEGADLGWTVKSWGEKWLDTRDINKTVRDPESDRSRWKNHVADDPIANLLLRSVRRRHVKAWLQRVRGRVARQTALNCLNIMRGLLSAAVEDELLKLNPAAGLSLPREKRTEEPWTFATLAEQEALVAVDIGPERWIIGFAIGTGLRAGELVALRLRDVHVDCAEPHVIVRYGGAPDEPTKGGKIRRVPLFGRGLVAAREWIAALPRWLEGKRSGKRANRNPNGLMFPRLRGGFRDHLHVLRWDRWQAVLATAGITRDFRWHDLRHTAASSLVSGLWGPRWELIEVRDFLGHESVTTTERYAHLASTALKRAAAEMPTDLAINRPSLAAAVVRSIGNSGASPARLERATLGLGNQRNYSDSSHYSQQHGRLEALSEGLLRAVAAGDAIAADAFQTQLGLALVADRTRAIEIAEQVLGRTPLLASEVSS